MPSSLFVAGGLIFLAMLFDGIDGAAARWANQASEFGAELDSLCDAISFGAAPAMLMLALAQPHGYHPRVLWVAAALYVICVVLRLARFNVQPDEEHADRTFSGLPSPAAAAVVASFPIMLFGPQLLSGEEPEPDAVLVDTWATRALPIITVCVAALMVSRIRYLHLFHRVVRGRRSGPYLIGLVFALAAVATIPRVSVPLIACWYAFTPPAVALWDRYLRAFLFGQQPAPPPAGTPIPDATPSNGRQ